MASVTPYDVIIFVVLIAAGLCISALVARFCCCCAPISRSTEPDEEDTSTASAGVLKPFCVRFAVSVPVVVGLSFCATASIFAILGAVGLGESFLFAPKRASECAGSCGYYSEGGLEGWVDEDCCTYEERLPGMSDVWLGGSDYGVVHGYVVVNATASFSGQGKVAIVYNHGSGGNVASGYRLRKYEYLLSLGNVAVFAYDYHGYGKSAGDAGPSETLAAASVATRWFANHTAAGWPTNAEDTGVETAPFPVPTSPATDLGQTVLLGESMGGAVAAALAKRAGFNVRGVMLWAAFLNLDRLARDYFPIAGWALGSVANKKYPDFDNEVNLNSGAAAVCRYHSHSPDDEWVDYGNHATSLWDIPLKEEACSEFHRLEAGTLHTQPLTEIQRRTVESWLASMRF
ncbi:hypothetical protein DIPPA_05373 [Diplonema papillatum]|nr:hypothetical protein DIPPA_05373 [Diplonema papillatum]